MRARTQIKNIIQLRTFMHPTSMQTETTKTRFKKNTYWNNWGYSILNSKLTYNGRFCSTCMRAKTHPHKGKWLKCELQSFTIVDLQTAAAKWRRTLAGHKLLKLLLSSNTLNQWNRRRLRLDEGQPESNPMRGRKARPMRGHVCPMMFS